MDEWLVKNCEVGTLMKVHQRDKIVWGYIEVSCRSWRVRIRVGNVSNITETVSYSLKWVLILGKQIE